MFPGPPSLAWSSIATCRAVCSSKPPRHDFDRAQTLPPGFHSQGDQGAPPETVCPPPLKNSQWKKNPENWSENNRKISIVTETCITMDLAPLLKKSLEESQPPGQSMCTRTVLLWQNGASNKPYSRSIKLHKFMIVCNQIWWSSFAPFFVFISSWPK